MKVINLFGGPGTGKSTTAAGLFNLMKLNKYNVELVTEYAKDLTWDERWITLENQLYVFAKQHSRIERLKNKVEWVVTDSPLLLSEVYVKPDYYKHFKHLVHDVVNSYDNYNFFLLREKEYSPIGRSQTEDEAKLIDKKIKHYLLSHYIKHTNIQCSHNADKQVFEIINEHN